MTIRGAFRHVLLGVVSAALVLAAGLSGAAKLNSQNLTQLIAESESIIAGTVKEVFDGIDPDGIPFTRLCGRRSVKTPM